MSDVFIFVLIVMPFITLLWLMLFLFLKMVLEEYGIDICNIFNRKVVDIPDFVQSHRNSEIESLFNERRKNDNEIQI